VHLNPSLSTTSLLRDGLFLLLAVISGKKTLVFFRGWHRDIEQSINNSRILRGVFRNVFTKADALIVLSQEFCLTLRRWGLKNPVYIETTAVDDNLLYKAGDSSKSELSSPVKLLFLARMEQEKGVETVLESYSILLESGCTVTLTIAGDGPMLNTARDYVEEHDLHGVRFAGHVTGLKKAEVFHNSDIYLFPSFHGEGMPNSVLEAMACGLPVVTRKVGGLSDFFMNGKMGYMTDSTDPKVFAELTAKLINEPKRISSISRFNARFAKVHFLSYRVAERLEKIHEDILNDNAADSEWMPNADARSFVYMHDSNAEAH